MINEHGQRLVLTAKNGQFVAQHHHFKIFRFTRPKQKDDQLQQALKGNVKD